MKKIFIIEDEQMLRKMYEEKFKQSGFKVVGTGEAEGALAVIKAEKPDIILLDILLPREDGVSFLKRLRKDPATSRVKVVAFSNYDNPQTREEAEKLNIEAYLLKANFTPQEVVEKVKEYLCKEH